MALQKPYILNKLDLIDTQLAERVKKADLFVNVKDYNVKGDGTTLDADNIQNAENAAYDLSVSTGSSVILWFPSGVYVTNKSINKKANVHWQGSGKIKRVDNTNPTGVAFALVCANAVDNWSIDGLSFETIDHGTVLTNSVTTSFNVGANNTCVDAYRCSNWSVQNCEFRKFSQGILYRGSKKFTISKNRFFSDNGKTVTSMLDGTYVGFSSYVYTGAIVHAYTGSYIESQKAENFIIESNYIEVPGLDLGIDGLAQRYDENPGLITKNIIIGANCAIQIYRGSYVDPGTAATYRGSLLVTNNRIYVTWEQGIYIRGVIGVTIQGNYLERVAQNAGGGTGASGGGIVTRANPNPVTPNMSMSVGVDILNNFIVNPGRDNVVFDGAIQIRVHNCRVIGNLIVREETLFSTTLGSGIVVDNGEGLLQTTISNNFIKHFNNGINWIGTLKTHDGKGHFLISANTITNCVAQGIFLDTYRVNGIIVNDNQLISCATGMRVKRSPYSSIQRNKIKYCTTGIELASGNEASNYIYLKSGNTYAGTDTGIRAGGTLIIRNNEITGCTTAHGLSETSGSDATFHGRCAVWDSDIVDGKPIRLNEFTSATPGTNNYRTWHKGEVVLNATITAGTVYSKVCTQGGTYGTSGTGTTGDTTSGSTVITNVSSVAYIGKGQYLSIGGTVKCVKDVDYTNNTITVDSNMSTTATGVVIALASPTFIDLMTTGAV